MQPVHVTALLDAVFEQPGYWPIASLGFMLMMDRNEGKLRNSFVSNKDNGQLDQKINAWIARIRLPLSVRAGEAISSPANIQPYYNEYYCGATTGYWIDEGLCVLHDLTCPI